MVLLRLLPLWRRRRNEAAPPTPWRGKRRRSASNWIPACSGTSAPAKDSVRDSIMKMLLLRLLLSVAPEEEAEEEEEEIEPFSCR